MKQGFSIFISETQTEIKTFISGKNDDFHFQNENPEILIEGVLLNKKKLLRDYASKDYQTLILELYRQKKEKLVAELEGEFRGFIYDKNLKKIYVFTNATSTQRVFYTKIGNAVFIDTNLVRLNKSLKNKNLKTAPDLDAVYQMLCFGSLLENKTILENVYKLLDGHFLEIDTDEIKIEEKQYFTPNPKEYYSKSKEKAIREIHEIFEDSVLMEYEKDREFSKKHLALLSGGLDSRVAMMYAVKNGMKPDNVFCFSQSGYYDEKISRKIAEDYGLHYEFVALDSGLFLNKIDELAEISEGLVLYTGGIHVQYAVGKLQFQDFGVFHSGQIGDGVLGTFNSVPKKKKPSAFRILLNPDFLPKVENTFNSVIKKYDSEEIFLMRNIAFNRPLLGAHVLQQKAYQTSPFMTKDFMKLALSFPEAWKYKHKFYLEWISEYCKEATKYTWERTLMKPNAFWKMKAGDYFLKPAFVRWNKHILKTPQKASMYPYQYYYDIYPEIREHYQNYFDENIRRLENYSELKEEIRKLFAKPNFYSKTHAINILAIFKLYF
ncbi:MAG: hypothetical protein LBE36_13650 [Flavobacteriaceae bacterium]|jgi:asparagine synthetase B (glutamine-hydrolysing)|nr:hypothetical protein [Flavobacteriaceae bacterium]